MLTSATVQTINSWAECQKIQKPWPLESNGDIYEVQSLTDTGWHWFESVPSGYTEIDHGIFYDIIFELFPNRFFYCDDCGEWKDGDYGSGMQEWELFDLVIEQVAEELDQCIYIILLDGEGFVFLTKEVD